MILAFLMLASSAVAATYNVAPAAGAKIELKVDKTGFYSGKSHIIVFETYHGTLAFNPQKPEESKIELTIDSASAVCKDTWVSANDLKKIMEETFGNMLAVKQYPTMTFTSTSIKPLGNNQFEAQGLLTIRAKPKPVTMNVQLDATDPAKLRLRGSAKIHLKDYGLKPPSALLGAIGTKEEMSLTFEIVASL